MPPKTDPAAKWAFLLTRFIARGTRQIKSSASIQYKVIHDIVGVPTVCVQGSSSE